MIDYTKITDNEDVIELLKQREIIETKIREIDETVGKSIPGLNIFDMTNTMVNLLVIEVTVEI